jgi:hypothetical protein
MDGRIEHEYVAKARVARVVMRSRVGEGDEVEASGEA